MLIETAVIVGLLKKPFEDLVESSKGSLKGYFQTWQAAGAIDALVVKIEEVEKLLTIASRNKSTISEIYYPAKVKEGRSTKVINRAEELLSTKGRCAIILGTAGQGKSTFLRFLCIQELKQGIKIPLFIELRKIDSESDLLILIKKYLITVGFNSEFIDDSMNLMLTKACVRLYLDGYDEIKREHSLATRDQIQTLLAKYPKLEIILSSRPGALSNHLMDLARSNQFEIAPLVEADFGPFFQKIGVEADTTQRLLFAIGRSRVQIKNLLSTPLMLTLLVMTCGMKQDLPDTLPEFFDSLFNLLASMHDSVKPGYVRQKATGLSNADLEKLFRAFCFISKESVGKVTLSFPEFENSLKDAEKLADIKCTTEGFRTDVTETICLMVKEGLDTTFAHKSIQEYYAASFIRNLDDESICKEVYKSLAGPNLFSWLNELRFLEDFDDAKYAKFFGIPQGIDFLLRFKHVHKKKLLQKDIDAVLKSLDLKIFVTQISKNIIKVYWNNGNAVNFQNRYIIDLMQEISSEVSALPPLGPNSSKVEDQLEIARLSTFTKQYPAVRNAVTKACQRCCDDVWTRNQKMQAKQDKLNTSLLSILRRSK